MLFVDRSVGTQLAIHLVPANQTEIVATGIEKHLVKKSFGIFKNGRFAGADFLVKLQQGFFSIGT